MGHRRGGSHHQSHEHDLPHHHHEHATAHDAIADTATVHEPVPARWKWKPYRRTFPLPFKVLLSTLLAVFVALGIVGQDARWRRTAEAEVGISDVQIQAPIHPGIDSGTVIRYTFDVAGVTYEGVAIRSWSLTSIREAKVCYEPADPHNQILVKRAATCP